MKRYSTKSGRGVLTCIISIVLLCESHVSLASETARKALGVIEIAAQQDPWYAQFLKSFLKLSQYSDDYNWDLTLVAHMAITQSTAMGNPLPLPMELQQDLLELFDSAIATFSEDKEARCIHNSVSVPYGPIPNPGRRPDTCVCYDLYVQNQAIINSLTVTGTETIGGSLIVRGSVIVGGNVIVTGTTVLNDVVVLGNESVDGSLHVSGPAFFSNINVTGTGTFGALSVLSTATIGGSLTVDGLIYQPNQQIPPNNIAYVQKSPITASNQFNSINAALSAISLLPPPSPINPYLIKVTPGVFVEPQLQMLSFVALQGSGALATVIQAATPNQNVIVGAGNSVVRDVTINGATSSGFAGVLHNQGGSFVILDTYLGNNNIQVNVSNNLVPNAVALQRCLITQLSQFARGFVVQGQGSVGVVIDTTLWSPVMNPLFQSFATATGPGVFLQINNSTIGSGNISPVLTGTAIAVQNGAFLRATGTLLGGFSEAIGTIAAGAAPKLLLSSVIGQNNTWDLVVQHPGTFGSVNASFTEAKTNVDPNSPLAIFLVDPTGGEIITEGHTQWGPNFSLATDIYYLLNQGWNTGVMSGGSLIFSSTSLVITVTAGVGYVMNQVPSPLHVQIVNWPTQSLALTPLTESFLYIAPDATLQSSVAQPADEFTILLGKAYTTTTGVLFAQEFFPDAQHTGERLTSAIENSLGVIYISGSMVSSTTANQLNVTTGSYVFGTQQYNPSGGSPIAFSTWMLTGTGGYMLSDLANPTTNVVDTLEWDPGTGTLSFIPTGSVTKHLLYIAGDGIYEHYLLQYGQQLFDSVVDAQNGPIIPQPSIWTGDIARIASIIVGPAGAAISRVPTSTGTIYSIQDLRPLPSFKGATISGVTVHGDLSGLLADDHPQYLLVNGTRAMAGDLQMNGNNIIMNNGPMYGLVDGVLVHQHGSRHLPLGQDPLITDTPVTIGTTNSIGIANAFVRSDHVHAHGNQPGGSLHAVATTSTAGFMSAADKTLLDSLVSSTHSFIQQGGNAFGAPITIGTQDNYALNLETNGTTWLTIASTGTVTLGSLSTGVVQSSNTGLLSSSAGANGQLLIGTGVSSSPVWANLTSNSNTIRITNGAGTIDLATTGSAATSYVTNAGTAIPASGVLNVLGGSNINTSGSGSTVTINLNNSPVIPGTLTVTSTTTLHSLSTGVVQASSTGLLSSSAGANGQLLIGAGVSSSPVWANLTSTGNTITITNGAGTINLEAAGIPAVSYVTNSGTAIPASGTLNVLGGSNITTSTTAASTIAISLVNSPVIAGTLTVTGSSMLSALKVTNLSVAVTATSGSVHADTLGNLTSLANTYVISYNSNSQSVANFTGVFATFNVNDYSVGGITNPDISGGTWTKFQVPTGGKGVYMLSSSINFGALAGGVAEVLFAINGNLNNRYGDNIMVANSLRTAISTAAIVYLNDGDFVQVQVFQSSGSTVNIGGGVLVNRFQMARIM